MKNLSKRNLYIISECEAQIGLNEMIIKDYQDDKVFVEGLQHQIDKWKARIKKLKKDNN